jgi:hypothetical protein
VVVIALVCSYEDGSIFCTSLYLFKRVPVQINIYQEKEND